MTLRMKRLPVLSVIVPLFTLFCIAYLHQTKNSRIFEMQGIYTQKERDCSCEKEAKIMLDFENTCSYKSSLRGPHQKVISYTFFSGETFDAYHRNYFEGIERNLNLMQKFYGPEWVMRLYFEVPPKSENMKKLCQISCQNSHILDLCNIQNNPILGNMSQIYPLIWRFLPILDPQVDTFFIRDLDSNLSQREIDAVQEFLKSTKEFHAMRDHPQHDIEILGGMWGAKLTQNTRPKFKASFEAMMKDTFDFLGRRNAAQHDQSTLKQYIWPWAKKLAMVHDSFLCKKYKEPHSPFPSKRLVGLSNFVGSPISENMTIKVKCPKECRPKNHLDWLYC